MKKEKQNKNNNGFTLIELLVVVLIIGILAAIALPQYRLSVAKTKYTELKTIAKSVGDAAHIYYLVHNKYPTQMSQLDVTFQTDDITIGLPQISVCRKIFGVKTCHYGYIDPSYRPYLCYVYSSDISHPSNVICRQEKVRYQSCEMGNICYAEYY